MSPGTLLARRFLGLVFPCFTPACMDWSHAFTSAILNLRFEMGRRSRRQIWEQDHQQQD
jgi:hypothetical protein